MTREQLEHCIRAACDVARDTELFIFGSQAILGEHPDAPPDLRASIEVDVQPVNRPEMVDAIDGALGELSQFHRTFGFYVHGVPIETATLPDGWEERTVPVSDIKWTRGNVGRCIEAHDLAASKLFAYREKDREFVRLLLAEQMVSQEVLSARIDLLPIPDDRRVSMQRWIEATSQDLER